MGKLAARLRVSFQAKVLAPVITILVLLMAITTWVVDRRITEQFETEGRQRLVTSEAVFKKVQSTHTESLLSRYQNLANEPRLKAISQLDDLKTLKDFFGKLIKDSNAQNLGADIIFFTSEDLINHTNFHANFSLDHSINLHEFQTNSTGLVQQVFDEEIAAEGLVLVSDRLFNVVSVPVIVSGHVAGVITFANEIGNKVATDFSQLTGSEIVFLANGRVIVSTLRNAGQTKKMQENLRDLSINNSKATQEPKMVLAGEHFFWRANRFETRRGETDFGYVLLSSYEKPWRMLQQTQQILLWVRVAGLTLAVLILWVLIQRVTRPLRDLRGGAEAVGRGDFSHRVKVSTSDECGDLAESFNQMTANMQSSREQLEKTVETLKTTRAQLVQSEKLSGIGEFVAGVAHELNNPLTAVIGFAELLQQSDVDERHKKYSKRIVQSAERCHKIVQNLLSFARQHTPERKRTNLNTVVESVIDILQYELRTSNIQVKKELQTDLPCLLADAHQIQQVFLNILNNARQAMEGRSNARVSVFTKRVGDQLQVIFEDNGPGISEENVSKIFNPFFTTKPVGKGTGLGLSLSYGIIQEHGGNISVKSKLGEGTAFIIELPAATDELDCSEQKSNVIAFNACGEGQRVLVIDDEESVLELTEEVLRSSGYQVDTVSNGENALQHLRQKRYDVLLCDWKMPGLTGQQIFEQLLVTDRNVANRMIFMTGDLMNEKMQMFLKEHDRICLAKPFSLQEFRSVMEEFTALPRVVCERECIT
jgi:two-component system, NtrC family, sensor kinase